MGTSVETSLKAPNRGGDPVELRRGITCRGKRVCGTPSQIHTVGSVFLGLHEETNHREGDSPSLKRDIGHKEIRNFKENGDSMC